MAELEETIQEAVEHGKESKLNSIVAVLVAVSATFMALCNVKDGNIVQAMEQAQARSVDQWAYYQAKGMKQNLAEQAVDELEFSRDQLVNPSPELRGHYDSRIQAYKEKISKFELEKSQIRKEAEQAQKDYDRLNFHDDQFDATEACLSVAIALFGITALTQKRWLLGVGAAFVVFGFTLGMGGFLGLRIHPDFLARLLG